MNFSVLISVYIKEKESFLKQSLQSIFCQTIMPNEVILVKDGVLTPELDNVIEDFTKQYKILHIVTIEKNVGLGKALNEGLKHCSYDLVARMDSDDICKPNRFEKQLAVFEKYPDVSVVGSWVDEFYDNPQNVVSVRKLPQLNSDIVKYAKKRNPFNHPAVMFHKQDVLEVGGYKHFYLFEDYYLWIRLLKAGKKFYNIDESLLFFRTNPQMVARRGGLKYAITEVNFFIKMHRMKIITIFELTKNILIRFPIRIMPNQVRALIYKKILR